MIEPAEYNRLEWETIRPDQLQELLKGGLVLAAEEVGPPLLEGIDLLVKAKTGEHFIINIMSNEPLQDSDDYLTISKGGPIHGIYG